MPSGMIPVNDPAITRGMNTVDDAKTLRPGECVRLLNAFPGNPPTPRNGCTGKLLAGSTSNHVFRPPGIPYIYGATTYVAVWIYNALTNTHVLSLVDPDTGAVVDLAIAEYSIGDEAFYDMLDIHSCIYATVSKLMTSWKSAVVGLDVSHKVIESSTTVRDLCITDTPACTVAGSAGTGPLTTDKWVGYAFQYVRRTDSAAFEAGGAISGIILPPDITASYRPKRPLSGALDVFLPGSMIGVENVAERKTFQSLAAAPVITITVPSADTDAYAQGATHIRVSRTLEQDSEELAQGATLFFLADLPIQRSATPPLALGFVDSTTNASQEGSLNQLVTGYTAAPPARFSEYVKGRLFLMAEDGRVYFSEVAGGDGGTVLATAQAYPQAWSSMFKPTTYLLDCDYVDGQKATGMKRLGEDLFMFKERKIFAVFGGEPTSTPLSQVSNTIGCAFPYTLTKCEIKGMFGKCLLFLGNDGPMVMEEGGRVRPFSEFKIKELWPEKSNELYSQLTNYPVWITNNCTAAFFKNTWWVMYTTYDGATTSNKVFGYYFDPDLGADSGAANGPLEFEFAEMA